MIFPEDVWLNVMIECGAEEILCLSRVTYFQTQFSLQNRFTHIIFFNLLLLFLIHIKYMSSATKPSPNSHKTNPSGCMLCTNSNSPKRRRGTYSRISRLRRTARVNSVVLFWMRRGKLLYVHVHVHVLRAILGSRTWTIMNLLLHVVLLHVLQVYTYILRPKLRLRLKLRRIPT